MNNITATLRNIVEVWKEEQKENVLGENDIQDVFIKNAYCSILPMTSRVHKDDANTEHNEHTYKIRFRKLSIPGIEKNWYFLLGKNRYDVDYYNEDFKDNNFLEVFCIRREE